MNLVIDNTEVEEIQMSFVMSEDNSMEEIKGELKNDNIDTLLIDMCDRITLDIEHSLIKTYYVRTLGGRVISKMMVEQESLIDSHKLPLYTEVDEYNYNMLKIGGPFILVKLKS